MRRSVLFRICGGPWPRCTTSLPSPIRCNAMHSANTAPEAGHRTPQRTQGVKLRGSNFAPSKLRLADDDQSVLTTLTCRRKVSLLRLLVSMLSNACHSCRASKLGCITWWRTCKVPKEYSGSAQRRAGKTTGWGCPRCAMLRRSW